MDWKCNHTHAARFMKIPTAAVLKLFYRYNESITNICTKKLIKKKKTFYYINYTNIKEQIWTDSNEKSKRK